MNTVFYFTLVEVFILVVCVLSEKKFNDVSSDITGTEIRYDGYKVFRLTLKSENHKVAMKLLLDHKITYWSIPTFEAGEESTNIMLAPHQIGYLLEALIDSGIKVSEVHSDVQKLFESQSATKKPDGKLDWTSYDRLADIYKFLESKVKSNRLAAINPNGLKAKVGSLGKSFEGRDILYIKISHRFDDRPKKAILIDSNIHAREWITSAVSTYLINELLKSHNDSEMQSWTRDFDWYIVPVLNPDGFEYSHTHNRFWRKNRSKSKVGRTLSCRGVDLNRNFGFYWNETGTSSDPCSDWYSGSSAFSEPETTAFANFVKNTFNSGNGNTTLAAYISLHSFGQFIILPYSFLKKGDKFSQYQTYMDIAQAAAIEHSKLYGTNFSVGTAADLLYPASGCSFDWMKGVQKVPLSLTYELRDTGRFSSFLPADQIIPSALEFISGLKVYVRELRKGIPEADSSKNSV